MEKRKVWRIANGLVALAALAFSIFSFCNNQLKTGIAYALFTVTCSINYIISRKIENNKE